MDLLLAEQTLLGALNDGTGRDTAQWAGEAGRLARLQIPALPARQPQKTQGRTAAERADRDDCLICRASFPL